MSNSKSNTNIILLAIAGMFFGSLTIGAVIYLGSMIHYENRAVTFEENINALSQASESTLSNGTMALLDKMKITEKYAGDLKEVLRETMQGRYSKDNNVAMKWIQENSQGLDSRLYVDISSYIEGMRKDFLGSQKSVLDQCRAYKTMRRKFWSGMFLDDYPSDDFNEEVKCRAISDSKTQEAFSTGVQTQIL